MTLPSDIQTLLHQQFIDQAAYGQLATVSKDHEPSVRTVHLHLHAETGEVLVNTHTHSEKWKNLATHSTISGCYWAKADQVQIRFKAKARRISDQLQPDPTLLEKMWSTMRDEVRVAYHLIDQGTALHQEQVDVDPTPRSSHHGLIVGEVFEWDVFWESPVAYRFGRRSIFTQSDKKTWEKKDVSSLHPQPVLL